MNQQQITFGKKLFTICLILISCAISFADQKNPIGKVVAIRGSVFAVNPYLKQRNLALKAPVFLHDTLKTQQGRIQLLFEDNTLITLGPHTEIELVNYLWKPGDMASAMETKIQEGSFRIMGGAITRIAPDNFKTHAPSGTIGIRGSMYAGVVKGPLLSILFLGGKGIYVKNNMGVVNITRPGFGTTVKSRDLAPETPKKVTQNELMVFETTLGTPAVDDRDKRSGNTENSNTDSLFEAETGLASPTPPPPLLVSEISPIPASAVLTAVQDTLMDSLTPTGTEQKILSMLLDLGFTGTRSITVPSSGIWIYKGILNNPLTNEVPENIKFIVNWDNLRIMALDDISASSIHINGGFGFGSITSLAEITNVTVLGSGSHTGPGNAVRALTGSQTFGHFYGDGQAGLGLAMEGYDVNIQYQTDKLFWSDIAAATVTSKISNPYSGTQTWNGFFMGIAEDMASPNNNRRIFYNTLESDYTLVINKDTGTFSGSLSGKDFNNNANLITGLTIGGGSGNSAFISDKTFAGTLGGSNVITISSNSGGLKTYGNFMVTSDTGALSAYTTWGYWEAAYAEPGTGKNYHIHVPGSLWIAGQKTPSSAIASLISTSFTGIYNGKAEGVMIDNLNQMTRMTNGTTSLSLNFASGVSLPVTGTIAFDQIKTPPLQVTSAIGGITTSGFQATVTGATLSSVNGTFYGPTAQGVGGNFSAKMPDNTQYHGIFAGDR